MAVGAMRGMGSIFLMSNSPLCTGAIYLQELFDYEHDSEYADFFRGLCLAIEMIREGPASDNPFYTNRLIVRKLKWAKAPDRRCACVLSSGFSLEKLHSRYRAVAG